MCRSKIMAAAVGVLGLAVSVSLGQDVYRKVTSEKIEGLLKELNITYKKTAGTGKNDGVFYYEFERNSVSVRLHNYKGEDLWIDSVFADKVTLEDINKWNIGAKFSRAVLFKDAKGNDAVSLESQLDCLGGVTDNIVKQYINRFDTELGDFRKFLAK